LAKLGVELIKGWNNSKGTGILANKTIRAMLTMEKAPSGLGWFLNGGGKTFLFHMAEIHMVINAK
jgi:hypothetical protein